ncbi:MAG: hypothetical protein AAF368_13690, partial [Planctomycetota bacterium]
GAEYLLQAQHEEGFWQNRNPDLDTVLALLFLSRATSTISKREASHDWRILGSAAEGGLVARVRLPAGERGVLECWLQSAELKRLISVDWILRTPTGDEILAHVAASKKPGADRFAAQISDTLIHGFEFFARGVTEQGLVLESVPVKIPERFSDEELNIARLAAGNLLREAECTGPAETTRAFASRAVDGSVATSWLSKAAAGETAWSAEFKHPVLAKRLVLLHPQPSLGEAVENRILKARVTLDRDRVLEVDLNPSRLRPTWIDLGEPTRVEFIELAILTAMNDADAGFAEILLLP